MERLAAGRDADIQRVGLDGDERCTPWRNAIRMVFDHTADHPSQVATMRSVAKKLGCTVEALRRWVRQAERDTGRRPGLTTDERAELKRLQPGIHIRYMPDSYSTLRKSVNSNLSLFTTAEF